MNTTRFAISAAVATTLLAVCRLPAQNLDLPFISGSTGADGPFLVPTPTDASHSFGIAYDEKRKELVRFGGISSAATNADTWIMRSAGWQKITPATSPAPAANPSMAYDAAREEVVLFAGGQTWTWNGTTWTQKTPLQSPSSRTHAAMCWDAARMEIVLFGGQTAAPAVLGDTWTWDGTNWTQKSPANSPSARSGHAMAFYPPLSSVAMTCGNTSFFANSNSTVEDLWLWNGLNWTHSFSSSWGLPDTGVQGPTIVYDTARSELLLFGGYHAGSGGVFSLNATLKGWSHARSPAVVTRSSGPTGRWQHGAIWNPAKNRMVVVCGRTGNSGTGLTTPLSDTWHWANDAWAGATGPDYVVDLDTNRAAVWHFTTINIPTGVTVRFSRNAANTPVVWLASEGVTISGTIDLNGQSATTTGNDRNPTRGGPGGYDGGLGSMGGSEAHSGGGPGAGAAGAAGAVAGGNAAATGTYVSPFGIPLMGGSGGGGAYLSGGNGSNGGAGGGAIAIASSKDITLNGTIKAQGGTGTPSSTPVAGHGGGGTVRLMADRILASGGIVNAAGGAGALNRGVVRLEAFTRQYTPGNITGSLTESVPADGDILAQTAGRLLIQTVDGHNVPVHPSGSLVNPDVVFSKPATEPSVITVEALNIPNGTNVTLQIIHSNGTTYNLPEMGEVKVQNGVATFSKALPPGNGTVQAFATYTVGQNPPAP